MSPRRSTKNPAMALDAPPDALAGSWEPATAAPRIGDITRQPHRSERVDIGATGKRSPWSLSPLPGAGGALGCSGVGQLKEAD